MGGKKKPKTTNVKESSEVDSKQTVEVVDDLDGSPVEKINTEELKAEPLTQKPEEKEDEISKKS